jgi:hypothetical protein
MLSIYQHNRKLDVYERLQYFCSCKGVHSKVFIRYFQMNADSEMGRKGTLTEGEDSVQLTSSLG